MRCCRAWLTSRCRSLHCPARRYTSAVGPGEVADESDRRQDSSNCLLDEKAAAKNRDVVRVGAAAEKHRNAVPKANASGAACLCFVAIPDAVLDVVATTDAKECRRTIGVAGPIVRVCDVLLRRRACGKGAVPWKAVSNDRDAIVLDPLPVVFKVHVVYVSPASSYRI